MQCACPYCQLLMALIHRGIESQCCCPNCNYKCAACLGTKSMLNIKQLKQEYDPDPND